MVFVFNIQTCISYEELGLKSQNIPLVLIQSQSTITIVREGQRKCFLSDFLSTTVLYGPSLYGNIYSSLCIHIAYCFVRTQIETVFDIFINCVQHFQW